MRFDNRRIANIPLIEEDLASTDTVPFVAMLKALAQRRHELGMDDAIDSLRVPESLRAEKKLQARDKAQALAKRNVVDLLEEAVLFCNGKSDASKLLKKHVKDM